MLTYKLSKEAYEKYISCTKGNKDLPFELAELKLNRNIKHGQLVKNDYYTEMYQYGTLLIECAFGEILSVYQAKKWLRIKKFEYS